MNLFINDIELGIHGSISVFADDTKVCRTITLPQDIVMLQEDLDKTERWTAAWSMRFNLENMYAKYLLEEGTMGDLRIGKYIWRSL